MANIEVSLSPTRLLSARQPCWLALGMEMENSKMPHLQFFLETVLLRLLQHRDMHAHSSHPLLAIGEVVSNFDGRCWAVQHQLPENDYFDLSAGDIAVEISRQALGHADGWSYGIISRKGEIYRGRWFPPAFGRESSQQLVFGVAHFCASLLSESN